MDLKVCEICGKRAVKTIGEIAWYCEKHYDEIITAFARNYLQRRIRDNHRKKMILENLKNLIISLKRGEVTTREIGRLMGLPYETTRRYLKQLEESGLVSDRGNGIWEIHKQETVMV